MSKTISVVGHSALDHLFDVEGIAGPNESYPIVSYKNYYGGGAANIAAAIAVLGGDAQLISAVGNDFASSGYRPYLLSLGVDLSLLYDIEDERTTMAYVFTGPSHDQSTYFYWGSSNKLKELDPPDVDFVHLATSEASFNARIAKKARFVCFDPGQDLITYNREDLEAVLANTNILFTNKHEIERVCEMTCQSFGQLKEQVDIIVVTYDSCGSRIFLDDTTYDIPVVSVQALDPTGAGDAYRAGFLVAYRKGYPLKECGRIGSTVASFAVEAIGCQTNLPDWDRMTKRYEENFGPLPDIRE